MNTIPIRPRQSKWLDAWLSENPDFTVEGYTDTDPVRVMLTVSVEQHNRLMTAGSNLGSLVGKQLVKHLTLAVQRAAAGEPPIPVKAARPKLGPAARGEVAKAQNLAKQRIQEMRDAKPVRVEGDIRIKVLKSYWMEWVAGDRMKHTKELRVDVKSNYIVVELHPKDAYRFAMDVTHDANNSLHPKISRAAKSMYKFFAEQFHDTNLEDWK
jgi:hypothetical protein